MKHWPTAVVIALLSVTSLGVACSGTAMAAPTAQISMDEAVKMAEQRFHARVVKAETQRNGAQTVYVLRLLNDTGKVWTVHVDATSGSVQ